MFGSLGFIKKSGSGGSEFWLPCMVVGAMDIPCEPLRSICATMYGNVRFSFTYLFFYSICFSYFCFQFVRFQEIDKVVVYLFGSPNRLIPKLLVPVHLHDFVHYSDGVSRNLHRVPRSIVSKRIKGDVSMSVSEKFLTEGLSTINFLSKFPIQKRFLFIENGRTAILSESKQYFSLKDFLRKRKIEPSCLDIPANNSVDGSPLKKINIEVPRNLKFNCDWLHEDPWKIDDDRMLGIKSNEFRALSIEFIFDAVSCINYVYPSYCVNILSVGQQLEKAIFDRYGGNKTKPSQLYWEAIHRIAACLSGKTRPGSIIGYLVTGYFPTADSFVTIPNKIAYKSFIHEEIHGLRW